MYEESLKQYVNEDIVYKRYKSGETGFNDFEKFSIKHCKDIESLLEQNRSLKSQLDFIDEQNRYIEKLEKRIDKAIEYIDYNTKYRNGADIYQFVDIESEILEPLKFILELDEENKNAYLKEFNDWLKEVSE